MEQPDEFDIDNWLDQHNIKHLKQIFIDHNMDRSNNLSLHNTNFPFLITDNRLLKLDKMIVQFIIVAIQSLEKEQQEKKEKQKELSSNPIYITTSSNEDHAMKQIQQQINYMKELKNELKHLEIQYKTKVDSNDGIIKTYQTKCLSELDKINIDIIMYMNELKEKVQQKHNDLNKQIETYQKELDDEKSKRENEINGMENVLEGYSSAINRGIKHFKSQIIECKNIMKKYSVEINDKYDEYHALNVFECTQREKRIAEIGKNAKIDFVGIISEINSYEKKIVKFIKSNSNSIDTYPWSIHIDQSLLKDIKNDINSIISITDHNFNDSKYEKQERSRMAQLQAQITKLHQSIKSNKTKICSLQQQRDLLSEKIKHYQETKSISKPNNFKIHVAIDFGTDGIAMAYAVSNDIQRVFIHTEWENLKFTVNEKPKTIILLDEYYNALKFGENAKYMYTSLPMMKDKWLLFERFRMSLYENKSNDNENENDTKVNDSDKTAKVGIVETLTATNGQKVKSSVVFIAAFKHLQMLAKKYLKRQKIKCKDCEYQWIITVPAIWNDEAKYKMRQWTINAGLVDANIDDQCKIVYEPDCASLAIQYEIQQRQFERQNNLISNSKFSVSNHNDDDNKYDENKELPAFASGDRYILVDAGGGTVDVACHQILGELNKFGVKEIHHPSGGPWGSCYIDDQFVKVLKNIFSDEWMQQFKQKHPQKYTLLLHNFQNAKQSFYEDQNVKTHNVRMPMEFLGFIQDKIEENMDTEREIEDVVSSCKVFGESNIVSLDNEYLKMDVIAWKLMFDHVMNPIIEHIKNLLNKPNICEHCKYLCLVGGLSTSSYFHLRMEWQFGLTSKYKLILIKPQRPILSVVMGAAYFGMQR